MFALKSLNIWHPSPLLQPGDHRLRSWLHSIYKSLIYDKTSKLFSVSWVPCLGLWIGIFQKFELSRQIFELEVSTLKIEYQFGLSNIYNKFPIVENMMNRIIKGRNIEQRLCIIHIYLCTRGHMFSMCVSVCVFVFIIYVDTLPSGPASCRRPVSAV